MVFLSSVRWSISHTVQSWDAKSEREFQIAIFLKGKCLREDHLGFRARTPVVLVACYIRWLKQMLGAVIQRTPGYSSCSRYEMTPRSSRPISEISSANNQRRNKLQWSRWYPVVRVKVMCYRGWVASPTLSITPYGHWCSKISWTRVDWNLKCCKRSYQNQSTEQDKDLTICKSASGIECI